MIDALCFRQAVCHSVLKSLIDKIEKKERADLRAQRKTQATEEKREKTRTNQLSATLFKQKEALKTDMMKKRALMEKTVQSEIQVRLIELMYLSEQMYSGQKLRRNNKV